MTRPDVTCRLCGGRHDWHDCDVVAGLKERLGK